LPRNHSRQTGLRDFSNPSVWYWLTVSGQALTGIGAPFIACLPTKISHQWFGKRERHLATAILGLSLPIKTILGSGVTPLFVKARKLFHVQLSYLTCITLEKMLFPEDIQMEKAEIHFFWAMLHRKFYVYYTNKFFHVHIQIDKAEIHFSRQCDMEVLSLYFLIILI
jgi:hypothetical protein